jgi:hypothetical protein
MNDPALPLRPGDGQPIWFEAARLGGRIAALLRAESPGGEQGAEATWGRVLRFLDAQHTRAQQEPCMPAPQALDDLVVGLGLSESERWLVVLAGMAEEHEGYGAAFAALHPRGESRPSWGLFAWLTYREQSREAALRLFHHSPLLKLAIVRALGDVPLPECSLRLADGLWPALQGVNAWPQGLAPLPDSDLLDTQDDWLASTPVQRALRLLAHPHPHTVLVRGLQPAAARMRAQQLARACAQPGLVFEWDAKREAQQLSALLAHCLVRRAMPVILTLDAPLAAPLWELLDAYPGSMVLAGVQAGHAAHSSRSMLPIEATPLTAQAQSDLWRRAVPTLADHADALSARYPIWPDTVDRLRRDLAPWIEAGANPTLEQCVAALKTRVDRADESFARRITPTADWKDLVLPRDKLEPLHDAVARVSLQFRVLDEWGFARSVQGRRGLRMLFSGLPGTGKTLAAEVIAHALHADLLVVDLARMVSKWIGETEKNLAAAFDQAEATGAVLFFDEADALFGKRTEVSDAHDRYANIESAYLLARLERFDSVAILATNLRQNMDKAFLRRFEYAIDFAEPAPQERAEIWRRHLPAQAPLAGDVDLDYFAALFPLSGAMIRNAALSAAFIAAGESEGKGDRITRAHIERALRREYEKSGRMCPV